jgi:hippurate hydrolase
VSQHIRQDRIAAYHPELTELRRDLHAHPELGGQETRTAQLIAATLRGWDVDVTEGVGGTGVVGTIRGRRSGRRAIALRADMDALPLDEQTGVSYASTHTGVMHACGHDGHMAVLLGAARYLAEDPDFSGTVRLIFQPAEEGRGGAESMLADGLFDRFSCDAVYGLHTGPGFPVGTLATADGPLMAGAGRFKVDFHGPGGHGGMSPHLTSDLTIAAAHYILALQSVVGRNVPPGETAVLSVGFLLAGTTEAFNIMPAELTVGGTMRCYSRETQALLGRRVTELAHGLAAAFGCSADVAVRWINPPLINPTDQAALVIRAARAAVGDQRVLPDMSPVAASEDFAHLLEARPGAFVFLGNGSGPDGRQHAIHTPHYDFNDAAIPAGVAYWVALVGQQLPSDGLD